jgi:ABC-2 type transport system ATP-binding protein
VAVRQAGLKSVHGTPPAAVTLTALTRAFGSRTVLRELSLTVERGERVAVLGGNGAGKTTLLRCIAGSLLPSAGTVLVEDCAPDRPETRAHIGAVLPGERSFALRLTGRENLRFFARLRTSGSRRAERAVAAVSDELQLGSILERRVSACSTGMVQQLAFARALLGGPTVLLLDEPTRSLDDAAVERLWAALDRRPALALLIATHRAEDVARCGAQLQLGEP